MSRRWRAGLVSFVLAPLLAVGVFLAAVYTWNELVPAVLVALVVAGAVALLGSRIAGYRGDETAKLAGWTVGSTLASLAAIAVAVAIAIAIFFATCDDCLN